MVFPMSFYSKHLNCYIAIIFIENAPFSLKKKKLSYEMNNVFQKKNYNLSTIALFPRMSEFNKY